MTRTLRLYIPSAKQDFSKVKAAITEKTFLPDSPEDWSQLEYLAIP